MRVTRSWALVIIVVCGIFWGSSFILMKKALVVFDHTQVGLLRIIVAGGVLLPFMLPTFARSWRQLPKAKLLQSSLVGTLIPAFLFPLAQTQLASGTTGVLNSLTPLFTLLLGMVAFRQKLQPLRLLGVGLGLAGAAWLILLQKSVGGDPRFALLIVLATLMYGYNTNFVKYRLADISPLRITGFGLSLAAIPCLYVLLFHTNFIQLMDAPGFATSFAAVCALGAIGTSLALWLYFYALKVSSAVGAASVTYLMPVVALGWALLDGEPFHLNYVWGLLAILGGVWLVNRPSGYLRKS
jgi:drug/metabolite transporter (DMT)-like permease